MPAVPLASPRDSRGTSWRVPHLLLTPHRQILTHQPLPKPRPHYPTTHNTTPTPRLHRIQRPRLFHLRQRRHYAPATPPTTSPIQTSLPNRGSKLPTHRTSTLSPPAYYTFPTHTFHSPPTSSTTPIYPATSSVLPPLSIWDTPPPTPVTASPSLTITIRLSFTAPSHRPTTYGVFPSPDTDPTLPASSSATNKTPRPSYMPPHL